MTQIIPLQPSANQSLSVTLDQDRFDLSLKVVGSVMAVDIDRNETRILSGQLIAGGTPLIPYQYLEAGRGNFLFETNNNRIPFYPRFGIDQILLYASAAELALARG